MYAWRRVDVAELNRRGREAWRSLGRIGKEELIVPGGTPCAGATRGVPLAPAAGGSVVTSETGTVVALEAQARALVVRMDDGGDLRRLEGADAGTPDAVFEWYGKMLPALGWRPDEPGRFQEGQRWLKLTRRFQ